MISSSRTRRAKGRKERLRAAEAVDLGRALAEAREEAGLTQRDLAGLTGHSNSTIAAIERGADVRWSNLERLLSALPGLAGRDLLPNPAGHPPAALRCAWEAHRDLFGFECDRATVTLEIGATGPPTTSVELERVRLTARRADALDLTALARIVSRAPMRVSLGLDGEALLREGLIERSDGAATHRFEVADKATGAFTYRATGLSAGRVQMAEDADPQAAATLAVALPIRRLKLVIRCRARGAGSPLAIAWLPAGMSEPWSAGLLPYLHVGHRFRRTTTGRALTTEIAVDRPPIGVAYALALATRWGSRSTGALPRAPARPAPPSSFEDVARLLAAARERAGLTVRALAADLGVSPSTIVAVEAGRGGRASLLSAYLRRFPELAPQDVLPTPDHDGPAGLDTLWRYSARLSGFITEEVHKISRIRHDGAVQVVMITRGLRTRGHGEEPVRLRTKIQRVLSEGETLPPGISGGGGRLKRRLVHSEGDAAWELVFPRDLTTAGTDYRRTYPWRPLYSMTAREAARRTGGEPPYVEVSSVPLLAASKRLTFEVRFPFAYRPDQVSFAAWHPGLPPLPDDVGNRHDLLSRFDHETDYHRRSGLARLRVHRPVPGVRFVIWWFLPP